MLTRPTFKLGKKMHRMREIILSILNQYDSFWEKDKILASYSLSQKQKNLVTEIISGIYRHQLTLEHIVKSYSRTRAQKEVKNCLFLGLYQLLFLENVSSHTAIHSTVENAKEISVKSAKYVNALLRNVQRQTQKKYQEHAPNYLPISKECGWVFRQDIFPKQSAKYLSIVYSYPLYLVKKWLNRYGETKCIELLQLGNTPPVVTIRIRKKAQIVDLEYIDDKMAKVTGSIIQLPGYETGDFIVQGLASSKTIELIDVKQHSLILDTCAAPGGKSFHLLDNMCDTGTIIACDKSQKRLRVLCENKKRLQLKNIYPLVVNAKKLPQSFAKKFDYVIVDAPCSNSAVFNKRVEARWRFTETNLQKLNKEQQILIDSASKAVKPGGILIYSTCSIETEENQDIIQEFLHKNNDFKCEKSNVFFPELPFVDGGSVHILRRYNKQ